MSELVIRGQIEGSGAAPMDDRTRVICRSRNNLLADRLRWLETPLCRGPVKRALDALENAWAMIWAIGHCWPEMGERLGLWERIEDGET